jgi:acetyltransferase-like isoleucine patch superfamily enzyme
MSRVVRHRKTQTIDFPEYGLTFAVRMGSLWYDTYVKPQKHAYRPLALPQSRSPAADSHTQQSASEIAPGFPTEASQLPEYAQPEPSATPNEVWPHGDRDATRFRPPVSPALAAQAASSVSHSTQPSLSPKSEKDKMLSGQPFLPNTERLVDERGLSSQASFRFNTAVQKAPDERSWLFRQLVTARWVYPRAGERQVTGLFGHGVNVSAPFHCDYGYNLSVGDNAVLGPGCQLLDSGRIVIGRNTKIGARVTISTLKEPTLTRPMEGSERTETAREVYIGENVYIGDGCIIEAGVCIGDNAIVRAGSVVIQASIHHFCFHLDLR